MTQTRRRWTWMVYMAGDNGKVFQELQGGKRLMAPMETQGYHDIAEMEAVGSTDSVAIVVQFDTLSDREHTYRLPIRPTNEARQIERIPEQNTGDPASLRDFIVWGVSHYPAEHYAVILWNHGTGWKEDDIYAFARQRQIQLNANEAEIRALHRNTRLSSALFLSSILDIISLEDEASRAIAFDDSSMDFLDNAKLKQAFQEAEAQTGQKISLIGMDACLMNTIEVTYQLRGNATCMVGSQEVEPLSGWPYMPILQALIANPTLSPDDLAKRIVCEYGHAYDSGLYSGLRGTALPVTQSAIDLSQVDSLAMAVGRLAALLRRSLEEGDLYAEVALSRAQRQVMRFQDRDCADLSDFFTILRNEYEGENTQFMAVLDEVLNCIALTSAPRPIIANVTLGKRLARAKGLSIYLPSQGYSHFYDRSDFATCGWGQLLSTLNQIP